jgi:putative transposase
MKNQIPKTRRPSLRLRGYDYTRAGLYFVTSVTRRRGALFGEVIDGEMRLNRFGEIVEQAELDLPRHYPNVELGEFIVRPNHFHGIIILNDSSKGESVQADVPIPVETLAGQEVLPAGAKTRPYRKNRGLSESVRAFKSFSARRINLLRKKQGIPVWQRGYYDHIIRNQQDLELTWLYIQSNPGQWPEGEENPGQISGATRVRSPRENHSLVRMPARR